MDGENLDTQNTSPISQEINSLIDKLYNFIHSNYSKPTQNLPEARLIKIQRNLKEVADSFGIVAANGIQSEKSEMVVWTVSTNIIAQFLSPISRLYLASTSSYMLKLLAPEISKLSFYFPEDGEGFKHHHPSSLILQQFPAEFPDGVTKIQFDHDWEGEIKDLPSTITHLTFGARFNAPVDNILPASLLHIAFGCEFDQNVDHLPGGLQFLRLGQKSTSIVNSLPLSLETLIMDGFCNSHLDYLTKLHTLIFTTVQCTLVKFPPALTSLKGLNSRSKGDSIVLPPLLKTLSIAADEGIPTLPPSLTSLELGSTNNEQQIPPLPQTITSLAVFGMWEQESIHFLLDHLPPLLSELTIFHTFNRPLLHLPPSLTSISLNAINFSNKIESSVLQELKVHKYEPEKLSLSITHLTFNDSDLPLVFPPNLVQLYLGPNFWHPIKNLPQSLTHLHLTAANRPLVRLPPSLTHLTITCDKIINENREYQNFENYALPKKLQDVKILVEGFMGHIIFRPWQQRLSIVREGSGDDW